MDSIFDIMFDDKHKSSGYKNNDEHINDEIKVVDMMLTYYNNRISGDAYDVIKDYALGDFKRARNHIDERLSNTDESIFLAGKYFRSIYKLSDLEWFFVVCALAEKMDIRIKKRLLKIDDTNNIRYSSVFKLYFFEENAFEIKDYFKMLFEIKEKLGLFCLDKSSVKIDERVFENIMSNAKNSIAFSETETFYPKNIGALAIREDFAQKAYEFFNSKPENTPVYFYVHGAHGIGKTYFMNRVCGLLGKVVVCFDFAKISPSSENFMLHFMATCREASFLDGFICLENFERVMGDDKKNQVNAEFIIKTASKFTQCVFVFSCEDEKLPAVLRDCYSIAINLENLNHEESFKIWSLELKDVPVSKEVNIHELANKFTLNPLQIRRAVREASLKRSWSGAKILGAEDLSSAAYTQITRELSDKATLIKKKHTWDELVLPEEQKKALERACNQIKYKHIVYDEWNLKNTVLYGTGLSMLFTGPPGTGKTMAAQVIASELHLEIYRVDLSRVVSKYIGETEKNLAEIFDSAKKSNVILLFDETDALFGKRTEVKDSHDKHANLETAYLLQKMEEYNGITIMTTNLLGNLDQAFFRRISYVVHFPLPDEKSRKMIWEKIFPKNAPLSEDVDFDFLARKFEISGGNIKNVVITSTFMAAAESKKIEMKHIVKALEYEMKKQGKMISKGDFAEYGYLL